MDLVKDPAGNSQGNSIKFSAGNASAGIFDKIHYAPPSAGCLSYNKGRFIALGWPVTQENRPFLTILDSRELLHAKWRLN